MIYYPVIIPTLNRAEHLKRCLLSLMKNTGAENTEVYLSVDFPPNDKYRKGYNEVCELLQTLNLSNFKKVNIFYQKQNLGAVKNFEFLLEQAKNKYDAYIYSEDDNEFSKNFLQYMNKGLEIFKQNDQVLSICGCKDTNWETNKNNYSFVKLFAAYGVGVWFDKKTLEENEGKAIIIPQKPYSLKKMYKFYKQNKCLFCIYILSVLSTDKGLFWRDSDTLFWCDTMHSIYMHFTDKVCIAPVTSKSRTWGNDGTGINMSKKDIDLEKEIPLDQEVDFEFDDVDNIEFIDNNYKLGSEYLKVTKSSVIKAWIIYIVLLVFGKNRKAAIKFIQNPRNIWKRIKQICIKQ